MSHVKVGVLHLYLNSIGSVCCFIIVIIRFKLYDLHQKRTLYLHNIHIIVYFHRTLSNADVFLDLKHSLFTKCIKNEQVE